MSNEKPVGPVIEELWKSEVTSQNAKNIKDGLFGFKPPLPPVISAEPVLGKENIPPNREGMLVERSVSQIDLKGRDDSVEAKIPEID